MEIYVKINKSYINFFKYKKFISSCVVLVIIIWSKFIVFGKFYNGSLVWNFYFVLLNIMSLFYMMMIGIIYGLVNFLCLKKLI